MSIYTDILKGGSNMKKYQVIGGQYQYVWYGESDSLRGARIIASKHQEYWDNWQGWHTPSIYGRDEVVVECVDEYGNEKIVPMLYAVPFGKKANDGDCVRRDGDRVRDYGYWFKTFGVEENK